jgi:hypothetical protein
MITELNHKVLISQFFVTDCTKKGLASMDMKRKFINSDNHKFHQY